MRRQKGESHTRRAMDEGGCGVLKGKGASREGREGVGGGGTALAISCHKISDE